jgi:hypothetical protein
MGILTYLVAPAFLSAGLLLILSVCCANGTIAAGLAPGEIPRHPRIDFNVPTPAQRVPRGRVVTFVFLMFTALGSYRTYEFTESVQFCGRPVTRS